jgi:hypothetical protein
MRNLPRIAALCALIALGGCARSVVVTNISNQDITLTRSTSGGEMSYTIHPGAELTLPAKTWIEIDDRFRIGYR